jgi:hypothetical protein
MKALTSEWQSGSLIACQVIIPPDAIARVMENRNKYWNSNGGNTALSARSGAVARVLYALEKQGVIEKQKIGHNKNEYRLAQHADAGH